ncbi:MAG: hypothetical protein JO209_09725 [Acidisphaera sp.]|nr:hypothetical protein [Acidisphaera sp.]
MYGRRLIAFLAAIVLAGCAGPASTVPRQQAQSFYPPGSLHAPLQDDPERAGPGGTINPVIGVGGGSQQSGGW